MHNSQDRSTGVPANGTSSTQPATVVGGGEDAVASAANLPVYEQQLTREPRWALSEGSRHFEENSAVFQALHKIAKRLEALGIPYAVVGGMALFQHGLRRFTEDVNVLVTKDDLRTVHSALEGLGYLPPHRHSKHLRDTQLGVRIEFLTTGEYPGDGKVKPVVFPDPQSVSFKSDGISYINLHSLIELKLASGMTNPGRLKDLADVMELVKLLNLSADFAQQLNPYVQDKYWELWRQGRVRYVTEWHRQNVTGEVMEAARQGILSVADAGDAATVRLVTYDPGIAARYDMVEEPEFWGADWEEGQGADADTDNTIGLQEWITAVDHRDGMIREELSFRAEGLASAASESPQSRNL